MKDIHAYTTGYRHKNYEAEFVFLDHTKLVVLCPVEDRLLKPFYSDVIETGALVSDSRFCYSKMFSALLFSFAVWKGKIW